MRALTPLIFAAALSGCSTISGNYPKAPLLPNASIYLWDGMAIAFEDLLAGAAVVGVVYYVIEPQAPNWSVQTVRMSEDRYRFEMRMKRFHMGGEGEAMQLFKRQAEDMMRAQGYASYTIARYDEGMESNWIAERVASGDILLKR
ncbi:hypothetical protein [Niveibacterium umoris]|uniref:Lipoprotein n=1 Tax=Niveibacterium umoris TaxID=1193620 RepID=A0A840BDN3_9RHOO|nr:hypothetical protein [Niveibacterium umoris]MBB4011140.1 hypothetical protein [Niveibacterium umoris]